MSNYRRKILAEFNRIKWIEIARFTTIEKNI